MTGSDPDWIRFPPAAFDIVASRYPERGGASPGPKLRPCLVIAVLKNEEAGGLACRIVYGTTSLKILQRRHLDLIIQDPADLEQIGLINPTRFDLDNTALLPWVAAFFGVWSGYRTPRIGALTEKHIREYAFLALRRDAAKR